MSDNQDIIEAIPSRSTDTDFNPSIISVPGHGNVNVEETFRKRGYEISQLLGQGAYAKVYLASYTDPKLESKKLMLACKIIDTSKAPKEFVRKFFPREMALICKINHRNIVRVHSILKISGKHFIFMTFCENGDILKFMKQYGAIREKRARLWFGQILDAIGYLHGKNIVHRDLKCENILLTKDYNVRLADFGFARSYIDDEEKSRTFCGSVMYAPPELIHGKPYNPKLADLWSLGVVLYIMLNKSMPFDDSSLRKLYDAQMNRRWKIRTKLKDVLSQEVKNFLYNLLEPIPENRLSLPQLKRDPWFLKTSLSDSNMESITSSTNDGGGSETDNGAKHAEIEHSPDIDTDKHKTLSQHSKPDA